MVSLYHNKLNIIPWEDARFEFIQSKRQTLTL